MHLQAALCKAVAAKWAYLSSARAKSVKKADHKQQFYQIECIFFMQLRHC